MNSLFPGKTRWNNGYSRIDDCKSGKVARGLGLRPARQQIQCFAADELADGFLIAQGKKNAARKAAEQSHGREMVGFFDGPGYARDPSESPTTYNSDSLRLLSSGRITNRCPLLQQYTTLSASRKFHLPSWSGISKGRAVSSSDSQTAQRLGWSMAESLSVPAENYHAQ
jgi:hypothetical protein